MVYLGIPCHNGIGPQNPMGSPPPLQHPFQATPIAKLCQRAQRQQQGLFGLASMIARLLRTMKNVEEMYFSHYYTIYTHNMNTYTRYMPNMNNYTPVNKTRMIIVLVMLRFRSTGKTLQMVQ